MEAAVFVAIFMGALMPIIYWAGIGHGRDAARLENMARANEDTDSHVIVQVDPPGPAPFDYEVES